METFTDDSTARYFRIISANKWQYIHTIAYNEKGITHNHLLCLNHGHEFNHNRQQAVVSWQAWRVEDW